MRRTGGTETSEVHPRKRNQPEIPPSSGERTGRSPEPESACVLVEASGKARDGRVIAPVHKSACAVSSMSRAGHVVSLSEYGGTISKAKYS